MTHGRYPFTTNITDPTQDIVLFTDLETEIDVDVTIRDGELECICTEVYVEGRSLAAGDDLSRLIRLQVMEAAEAEMARGGWLWDEVRDAEELVYQGLGGNDPDGRWVRA